MRQAMNVAVARRLEVDRNSIGQPRGFFDLRGLRAGQELDVDVAGEALAAAEQVERRQHAIGGAARSARHPGGQEQSRREALAMNVHERACRLVRRNLYARYVAAAERRAI